MFSDESFLPACSKEIVPFQERKSLINPVESNPKDFSLLTELSFDLSESSSSSEES